MGLDNTVQEMTDIEKTVTTEFAKSIEFSILGSTLKAGAAEKKVRKENKMAEYKKQIKELGGEVKPDSDDMMYGMEPYGGGQEQTERQIRDLNWEIQSCQRSIKTCERIIAHCEDKKKYKLMDYEMEEYGL